MNLEETESLLRRARPRALPPEWREQILDSALRASEQVKKPLLPRLAWSTLAACWTVILLLHATTPVVPQGTIPFDPIAYAARAALIEQLASLEEWETYSAEPSTQTPPATQEPIRMEIWMKLRSPHASPSTPSA